MTAVFRVAFVSAVAAAIPPTEAAFASRFPEAERWNLLDDRLLHDAASEGVTPHLASRMERLVEHAITEGADAVLLTCSMYAPVAHAMATRASTPIAGPDDAVFAAALAGACSRVLVVSSAPDPLADSVSRLEQASAGRVEVAGVVADGALVAARAGDAAALATSIERVLDGAAADVVVLGQYSLSPAADALRERMPMPVLAGPELAAIDLRARLLGVG